MIYDTLLKLIDKLRVDTDLNQQQLSIIDEIYGLVLILKKRQDAFGNIGQIVQSIGNIHGGLICLTQEINDINDKAYDLFCKFKCINDEQELV